jgi:tetratricopeptide (TPR) repeat protein
MTRLRLGFALTILAAYAGFVQSAPIYTTEAEVMDRLAPVYATRDPVRLARAYRAMGDYGLPAADIVESSINAMGYQHLENGEVDEAISVFELNTDTFPLSSNAWDSLAEAAMSKGDHDAAIRYYQRSLELNPDNNNAARMIERITDEQQLIRASSTNS